ncbi:helix-turn-helix domain-containing protein [Flintibacter sp.]|uniref:helix-turn-helix domain-containing protein n=1 Tax=Flintibacter sp. TaxID=1918624 RepID=UPI003A1B6D5E
MDYMTVRRAAEKWNLSPRSVQQLCTQGRIPGAGKFGKAWAIPANAEKPAHPQQGEGSPSLKSPEPEDVCDSGMLMPLMNTPFLPGRCLETVRPWQRVPSETLRWRSTTISAAGRNRRRWKWSPKLLHPAHLL